MSEETSNDAEEQNDMEQNENEITSIKTNIHELEKQVEHTRKCQIISDNPISCLLEEKEKLTADLRSQMRHNESLAEQLKKEQEYYRKEKKQFHKEMCITNERKKNFRNGIKLKRSYSFTKLESEEVKTLSELRQENHKLKKLLSSGAKITFSICMKFQRIKKHKDFVQNRLLVLEDDLHNITAYVENLLKDNKHEIDSASARCFSEHIHKKDPLFLETNQRNHLLILENLALKSECKELQNSLQEKNSKKRTKASESDGWLPKNSVSYYQSISSCQMLKTMKEDTHKTDSFCDAAILEVATAYVSRLTPSMLDRNYARNGKVVRRKATQHQRVIHNGHNIMIRTRSSPVLSEVSSTKPVSRK